MLIIVDFIQGILQVRNEMHKAIERKDSMDEKIISQETSCREQRKEDAHRLLSLLKQLPDYEVGYINGRIDERLELIEEQQKTA